MVKLAGGHVIEIGERWKKRRVRIGIKGVEVRVERYEAFVLDSVMSMRRRKRESVCGVTTISTTEANHVSSSRSMISWLLNRQNELRCAVLCPVLCCGLLLCGANTDHRVLRNQHMA